MPSGGLSLGRLRNIGTEVGAPSLSKRSIQDFEIGLIKAMLAEGWKNKDIQFFFNRRDRSVNSGRISSIRSGTYSDSAAIAAAPKEELDRFVAGFSSAARSIDPGVDDVRALFVREGKDWSLRGGESEQHECKQDFDPKKLTPVVRAIAALANNKGGYLFFGVVNAGFRVEGVGGAFARTDIVEVMNKVKAHLSPTPSITDKGTIELDGRSVGFMRVERHPDRPVIVYRDGEGLNEGEILYRYPGQSSRIKFGDLRAMLDERDRRAQVALAKATGALAEVGTSNAMILDTDKHTIDADGRTILLDEKLVDQIKFIKEGEFDEKSGAPTLRLIGEVKTVSVGGPAVKSISREAIFQEHILDAFLNSEAVEHPFQFIVAGLAQSRLWLPIFFFARTTGRSNEQIGSEIAAQKIAQQGKKKLLLARLSGQRTAFAKGATDAARRAAKSISDGSATIPSSVLDVSPFLQGMTAIVATTMALPDLLRAISVCRDLAESSDNATALGAVYKASCRIDELFFRDGTS